MHHVGLHHSAQMPTPLTDHEMVSHLMQIFVEALAICHETTDDNDMHTVCSFQLLLGCVPLPHTSTFLTSMYYGICPSSLETHKTQEIGTRNKGKAFRFKSLIYICFSCSNLDPRVWLRIEYCQN